MRIQRHFGLLFLIALALNGSAQDVSNTFYYESLSLGLDPNSYTIATPDSKQISVTVFLPPAAKDLQTLIWLLPPSSGDSKNWLQLTRALVDNGYTVFLHDFRQSGATDPPVNSRITVSSVHQQDLYLCWHWVQQTVTFKKMIGLAYGESASLVLTCSEKVDLDDWIVESPMGWLPSGILKDHIHPELISRFPLHDDTYPAQVTIRLLPTDLLDQNPNRIANVSWADRNILETLQSPYPSEYKNRALQTLLDLLVK